MTDKPAFPALRGPRTRASSPDFLRLLAECAVCLAIVIGGIGIAIALALVIPGVEISHALSATGVAVIALGIFASTREE